MWFSRFMMYFFFFFNDTATTEIYTLSLHDALPIFIGAILLALGLSLYLLLREALLSGIEDTTRSRAIAAARALESGEEDRKSTRLNSSHANISYAVFCLKKKKIKDNVLQFFQTE